MTQKLTSADNMTPLRVVIVTLDSHLASACDRAQVQLRREMPGLTLALHAASEFCNTPAALEHCLADIAKGDIIICTMLFMEDHISAVLPALQARRMDCDAMVACMSAPEVVKLTRMGRLSMAEKASGMMSFIKKLRGKKDEKGPPKGSGASQMAMLRRLPKILRFIPGTAQDLRVYFLTLQYWLAGSDANAASLVRLMVDKYAAGPRAAYRGMVKATDPVEYPEVGVYHPRLAARISDQATALPKSGLKANGRVGVLVLRSYILAGNTAHYDGVIAAFEAKGLEVVPAFASGLDARPAIDAFFMKDGLATVDALVSLTGFSLVGGPAYNDSSAAEDVLARLDVPYIAAQPVEFQTLEQWGASGRGFLPVESTIMVAIPELDGASGPIVFGGRSDGAGEACTGCSRACVFESGTGNRDMHSCGERAEMLAARISRLVSLKRSAREDRKIAITLFAFPPNAGSLGTAAFLAVFESLFNVLKGLRLAGYKVDLPMNVDTLRARILEGNAASMGALANVHALIPADDQVRNQKWLKEIEAQWGPAPGRQQSDGQSIQVLGEQFGNVFVGIQPGFGYEGDPMRLLFEKGFAPTHAFTAYYRYINDTFKADAVLHFGTHGALEFMPGKQVGLSAECWPDRLIGDMPNYYLYAANNPSEGALAKRRSAATLVSYLTPPVTNAGLYKGLLELKSSLERWRTLTPDECDTQEAGNLDVLSVMIQQQAAVVDLAVAEPLWGAAAADHIMKLAARVLELEYTLIPVGLHVVGEVNTAEERCDMLRAMAEATHGFTPDDTVLAALIAGETVSDVEKLLAIPVDDAMHAALTDLAFCNQKLVEDHEVSGLIKALDGRFIRPAPGGDLIRTPAILPTGRNLHGFDPFRIPSAFAMVDGKAQADRVIAKHMADGHAFPDTIALVLWGTDNLKSEGGPIAQALSLMGAVPRFDAYGRLAGADLISLEQLGRPRVDVVMTLSGIFRDLLPLQIKLLAEASFLAASADEPLEMNHIRRHALAYQAEKGCDLETAALRVFSNADGAYGANVNLLIDNGRWEDDDELAETYTSRKCFAYGRKGVAQKQDTLLKSVLGNVQLAYQNLESAELGVTTVDQYVDTLGGISRAVAREQKGVTVPVYIGDQTKGGGTVRTLGDQVALETRTRALNPKWYEGMLKHGYEGVRNIELQVQNTMGWSATTGQVEPWVYQQLTQLYVLDPAMRERMASLNSTASVRLANRLLEAKDRNYWNPDPETLAALEAASEELEDILEGVTPGRIS
jgi:magnesium chelatase subunit H